MPAKLFCGTKTPIVGVFVLSFFDWNLIGQVLPDLLTYGLRNTLFLAVISSVLGSVVGGIIGASHSGERWEQVPANRWRLSAAPRPHGGFALGLSVAF